VRRTYDLPHFRAIHRQFFQDVYEWAGDVRTVGLSKGEGDAFVPPLSIEIPLAHVASRIQESEKLCALPAAELPGEFAYLYDYANFAHPFREGNGRVQREFFTHLAAESGHGLDWDRIDMGVLHGACHTARNDENIEPMVALFESILTDEPASF
jgi:cell filamentation protein